MTQYKVTAPAVGHSGDVAGVPFRNGEGVVDGEDFSALRYFQSHGYGLEAIPEPEPEPESEPAKGKGKASSGKA